MRAPAAASGAAVRLPARIQALPRALRGLSLVLVVGVHAGGLYGISRLALPGDTQPAAPIQVALIEAARPAPQIVPQPPQPVEAPRPVLKPRQVVAPKPRPRPVEKVQPAPQPLIESPSALSTPEAQPVAEVSPAVPDATPAPAVPSAPPASAVVARPGPAAALVEARFDADYLNNPAPAYPPISRRMREEGRVMLRVQVSPEGRPGSIQLSESSGSGRLDRAAQDAVARWRFVPARRGELAVESWVLVPIVFKLQGS